VPENNPSFVRALSLLFSASTLGTNEHPTKLHWLVKSSITLKPLKDTPQCRVRGQIEAKSTPHGHLLECAREGLQGTGKTQPALTFPSSCQGRGTMAADVLRAALAADLAGVLSIASAPKEGSKNDALIASKSALRLTRFTFRFPHQPQATQPRLRGQQRNQTSSRLSRQKMPRRTRHRSFGCECIHL
jgi:hypothetical protein